VGTGGVNDVVLEQQGTENMKYLRKLIGDTKGATAIEYGLIAALIAVAMITAVKSVGTTVGTAFNSVSGNMN
jgi:pilus assembly protein Flp/PilA